jgi:hypothetical protein
MKHLNMKRCRCSWKIKKRFFKCAKSFNTFSFLSHLWFFNSSVYDFDSFYLSCLHSAQSFQCHLFPYFEGPAEDPRQ